MYNVNTQELIEEANKSILFTAVRPDIIMEKGKGMYLWDTEGKAYLDFVGGWAVNCLGHCPEVITDALSEQSHKLINSSPSYFNIPMVKFAKLLIDNSCFDRVFFTSTGAEANEGAIKLARKYGGKFLNGAYEIITMVNGFHGRTLATMSATGKKQWEDLFEPKVEGFKHAEFNSINSVESMVNSKTCAIMLEPIQGEGGVRVADMKFIKALRKLCDEKKLLLIFDEVQTGIGRTGKLFAYEHYGIEPDIVTLGKGIGGGFPLSALLTKEKHNIFEAGDQGGTYTGQPLGMAVGYSIVKKIIDKNICSNVEIHSKYLIKALEKLKSDYNISNIRGKGLLIAFDLPDSIGNRIVEECLKSGLLINSPRPSIIRLMPPLIVGKGDIDKAIAIIEDVFKKVL